MKVTLEIYSHGSNMLKYGALNIFCVFVKLDYEAEVASLMLCFRAFVKDDSIFVFIIQCAVHGEQYIMFSNTQKNMLCVNCFRDTPTEARLHCVDIDTAYTQGCKKLDRAIMVSMHPHAIMETTADIFHTFLIFSVGRCLYHCLYTGFKISVNSHTL
jgi:hypothetical protein